MDHGSSARHCGLHATTMALHVAPELPTSTCFYNPLLHPLLFPPAPVLSHEEVVANPCPWLIG